MKCPDFRGGMGFSNLGVFGVFFRFRDFSDLGGFSYLGGFRFRGFSALEGSTASCV